MNTTMVDEKNIVPAGDPVRGESVHEEGPLVRVGEWYWLKMYEADKDERIACVTEIGSNYVELSDPYGHNTRVHLDKFDGKCRLEKNPEAVIRGYIDHYRSDVEKKLSEIKELTARLGVGKSDKIEHSPGDGESRALAVLSGTDNIERYKKDLIKAKDKDLPKLFEEVKSSSKSLAIWMEAQTLSLKGAIYNMESCIEDVKGRIFNVSLYAGLSEQVTLVREGAPADAGEKLRIMQRLLFMDEECLLDYKHGGMTFKSMAQFDKWVAKRKNMDRILPFPRCMVAMRVRRHAKERDWGGDLKQILINLAEKESDKWTFLYIRNGEHLYRMSCDLDFDELIFPGRYEMDLSEPMMAKISVSSVDELITKREWESKKKEYEDGIRLCEAWQKENPKKDSSGNPYYKYSFWRNPYSDYQPFDKSSVYYDEMLGKIKKRIEYYNRISLIVQGLFDRSEILSPHPPVRLWSPEGFASAVELVYDGTNTLNFGAPPDFAAYMAEKNRTLGVGAITVGQDDFWQEKEAEKESYRMDRSRFTRSEYRPKRWKPYGNPGPGFIAKVLEWTPRTRKAKFEWKRERQTQDYWRTRDPFVPAAIWVPDSRLFNVSAYKPGEYLQFFQDPRTRAQYMKWAPLLLSAEEFHAGNLKVEASRGKE